MRIVVLAAAALSVMSCSAPARDGVLDTEAGRIRVETVADGLNYPWSLAHLPDGGMLVTERTGQMRLVGRGGAPSAPLAGVPKVAAGGQGGLLDVALDPAFATSRMVYFSFSEPGERGTAGTAVARGRLEGDRLADVQVIFRQLPKVDGSKHYGSRLAFAHDGKLFVTTGERDTFDPSQDLGTHLGKVLRINPDGTVPSDNPFVGRAGARPEIWSYGHRNVQGAAVHPETGRLWTHEMGPRGGDELNLDEAGKNYGWPLVSWGNHYSGRDIPDPPTRPELTDATMHWTPVISPSGMIFYTGDAIPAWRGSALIGGLSAQGIVRVKFDGARPAGEERLPLDVRIRHVSQGPDGAVYALTDQRSARILRLAPAQE
ncbi:MAG: PQQ-dependent sugar dehydrogenase [Rhodospirillales bacterium]